MNSHLPHCEDGPQSRGYEPDDVHEGDVVLRVDEERGDARAQDDPHRVRHADQDRGEGSLVVAEPELKKINELLQLLVQAVDRKIVKNQWLQMFGEKHPLNKKEKNGLLSKQLKQIIFKELCANTLLHYF